MSEQPRVLGRCPTTLEYVVPSPEAGEKHDCDLTAGHEGAHYCRRCGLMWTSPLLATEDRS